MNQDRFIDLVTKEFIGEITDEETRELTDLLAGSPAYQQRYDQFRDYLSENESETTGAQAMFLKLSARIAEEEPNGQVLLVKRGRRIWWSAAAAILILSATFFIGHFNHSKEPANVANHVVTTERGTKKQITLSDGTRIVLNAGSRISFPDIFTGAKREISLTGEAFFDVRHDTAHPFIIHTGKMDVKVLGTAFNVKSYPDDNFTETTLIRGKIEVTLKDRPADRIILKPTEKLIVSFSRQPAASSGVPAMEQVNPLPQITYMQRRDSVIVETSWVHDKIAFKEEPFGELAKTLERSFNVSIVFKDNDVKNLKFSGTFRQQNIREILDDLNVIEHFNYQIDDNRITIF